MIGTKLAVAVLAFAAFLFTNQVQKSIGCYICSNPNMLYLMAQYKMAVGDTEAGLRLLKKASASNNVESAPRLVRQAKAAFTTGPNSSRT
ncbi:MAG TPA: hypothetical protein VD837_05745 [Terriglobales bacterium]|nr:hypothetical protein [Terriglobales bacterium]